MSHELFAPQSLFDFCDAAGIRSIDIARQLDVSKTLVGLWRKGKRAITWSHYEALINYALDPATIWQLTQRLTTEGLAPRKHLRFPPGSAEATSYISYKLLNISAHHARKASELYQDIQTVSQTLVAYTTGDPREWNMQALGTLSQQLADNLKQAPFFTLHLDGRLEKAMKMLSEGLEHQSQQKDVNHGTSDGNGRSPGEPHP